MLRILLRRRKYGSGTNETFKAATGTLQSETDGKYTK